ncbi:hypothetical protein E2C01_075736 [Portunus trituberculatus]|uniref:Uncharacterized protein n=1 Tax=Portunus trituberculatus TaxID=210409 RepID=A0A5B7IFT7_PORTR|nr:hypothetical protein [Portunus trituberculatus]
MNGLHGTDYLMIGRYSDVVLGFLPGALLQLEGAGKGEWKVWVGLQRGDNDSYSGNSAAVIAAGRNQVTPSGLLVTGKF